MSGIVGILHLDGEPVDRDLLWRLTRHMQFRGPDDQRVWVESNAGLGHAMLRTTFEAEREHQPCTLDGRIWITADARVDARPSLIAELRSLGRMMETDVNDAELILHAFHAWGEECVHHLLGDFAFAIWDQARQRLFCARDHFGVKPFYYAHDSRAFIFSNTLNTLRLHPMVDDELNELAIADFLMFEVNSDLHRTTFAKIWRIPPAHTLTISAGGSPQVKRYWTLPHGPELRYRRHSDYIDHFREIFDSAVRDRLRTGNVSIGLSGGMDSSSIAATAQKVAAEDGVPLKLHAHTYVYDRLIPDQERYYSGLVAAHLKIPIQYQPLDDYQLFERWDQPGFCLPEPFHFPNDAIARDYYANLASTGRVALAGEGGDPLLCPSGQYLRTMLQSGRWREVVHASALLWRTLGRVPPIGVRSLFKAPKPRWSPPYPDWLNPDMERRLGLRERWQDLWFGYQAQEPRAGLFQSLHWPGWAAGLEREDPGVTRDHLEFRYPFLDARLMAFAAVLPAIPWCVQKSLLRLAVADLLPQPILRRWKKPFGSNGMAERSQQARLNWAEWSIPAPNLSRFVVPSKLNNSANSTDYGLWRDLVPLSLNWWLCHNAARPVTLGGGNVEHKKIGY